ncbi:MAG TPA: DUF1573 domain-containing protein [Treponema sp.]|nr:DUF1573 domain-containing protein [Treponema sp.]
MIFRKKYLFTSISVIFLSFLYLSSCFQPLQSQDENGSVLLKIAVPAYPSTTDTKSGARFIHPDTKSVVITVTASDMKDVTETKHLATGESEIIIELKTIPSGKNRTIEIKLFGEGAEPLAEGSTTIDIKANIVNPVSITAIPKSVSTLTIGTPSEKISSTMSGKTQVYSFNVEGKEKPYEVSTVQTINSPVIFNMFDSAGNKVSAIEEGKTSYTLSTGTYFLSATLPSDYSTETSIILELAQAPEAPKNFKITAFDGEYITLGWDKNPDIVETHTISYGGNEETVGAEAISYDIIFGDGFESETIFTIVAKNKFGVSQSATLTYIAATKITLDRTSLVLGVDKTVQLTAKVTPEDASLKAFIQWSSTDPNSATVDKTGEVTGIVSSLPSFVGITAKLHDRLSATADIYIDSSGFANGSGTQDSPYLVTNAHELNLVRYAMNAYFSQTEPITLTEIWTPIGRNSGSFTGTYKGNGKYIRGLKITSSELGPVGLFGVTNNATLEGIGLIGVDISLESSEYNIGALVGSAHNTTISRCFSNASIQSSSTGNVGGLVGYSNGSDIENCYATGSMFGSSDVAGLLGSATGGTITNCYAACSLGQSGQGLIGGDANGEAKITSSYWDTQVSYALESSGGGTGYSTAEMKEKNTFIDWGFGTIWFIKEDKTYPSLHPIAVEVEGTNGKLVHTTGDTVDFGQVQSGYPKQMEFTIYNNGTEPITPVVTLENAESSAYSFNPPFSSEPIAPGNFKTFTIVFTNSSEDKDPLGALIISSENPPVPDFVLNLTGTFCGN